MKNPEMTLWHVSSNFYFYLNNIYLMCVTFDVLRPQWKLNVLSIILITQ